MGLMIIQSVLFMLFIFFQLDTSKWSTDRNSKLLRTATNFSFLIPIHFLTVRNIWMGWNLLTGRWSNYSVVYRKLGQLLIRYDFYFNWIWFSNVSDMSSIREVQLQSEVRTVGYSCNINMQSALIYTHISWVSLAWYSVLLTVDDWWTRSKNLL